MHGNQMSLLRWISAHRKGRLAQRQARADLEAEVRLLATNITRHTVLADRLEVADSSAKRNKGLLGRKALPVGQGLWITPCESVHTFGMQFPIDLVYLDRQHRIRKVRSNVGPWRISACLSAHSVIELPSGTVRETQSKAGDCVEFSAADAAGDAEGELGRTGIGRGRSGMTGETGCMVSQSHKDDPRWQRE
jgi:hypothetical protein